MKSISDLLPDAVIRMQVVKTARAQQVARQWPTIVGDVLAKNSTPDRFDRGTLWVCASGSSWAQELRLRKHVILQRLNDLSDIEALFTDLRVGVRPPRKRPEISG